MIYIISSKDDVTTNYVIEWLIYLKKAFLRTNFETQSELTHLKLNNTSLDIELNNIDVKTIEKIWHRRGYNRFIPDSLWNPDDVYAYLKREEESVVKPIETILKNKIDYIGSYIKENENYKIEFLLLAKSVGLRIPNTLVTTKKDELICFYKDNDELIITKDLRFPIRVNTIDSKIVSGGTSFVTTEMIDKMDESFAPTLFQNKIAKNYEARIFFFNEKLYCMAILSQNDSKTSLDYRNYNRLKPNRCIPLSLPSEIKTKILEFVRLAKLKTGSIDVIIDQQGQYIFLEVNPQGQLDWVSQNCNYYIEKDIAEYLAMNK